MAWSFWFNYFLALVVVGLMMLGLIIVTRNMARGRVLSAGANRRLVTLLESTLLSQHVSVHVVRVGNRYLLIGGSNNGATTTLAEISAEDVDAWIATQRETANTVGWKSVLAALRGRS